MKNFKLWIESIILTVAVIWVILSNFIVLAGDANMWFARSGAILVLAAVVVEFSLGKKLLEEISNATVVAGVGCPVPVSVPKQNDFISIAAHICAVTGSIIWAYGDLF